MSANADLQGQGAERQRTQWAANAHDWAGIQEPLTSPLYWRVLSDAGVRPGTDLLDAGCGGGVACRIARDMGANVTGIDVTPELLDIARHRVPHGTFDTGEIDSLPAADDSFDVTTAFASIMFAADPVRAAGEMRRVTRSGGKVGVAVPVPGDSDWWAFVGAVADALPEMPAEGAATLDLADGSQLEELLTSAGMEPGEAVRIHVSYRYCDRETVLRAMMAPGPMVGAVGLLGEDQIREIGGAGIEPFRADDGTYLLDSYFTSVIATV